MKIIFQFKFYTKASLRYYAKIGLKREEIPNVTKCLLISDGNTCIRADIMTDDRHYTKKQYTGNWSAFGTAAVFAFVGVLGIVFLLIPADFIGLSSWGYYMFIPAFFILLGGISGLYTDRRLKNAMLATAQAKGNNSIKLEDLSAETSIRENDILRILLDLRNEGMIKYRYETASGEIVFGESINYHKSSEFTGPMTTRQASTQEITSTSFCPYCGHKPPAGSQFCESCGSKLV